MNNPDFKTVLEALESTDIMAWIFKHNIKTELGLPLDFERFSFMIDPYRDWTPEQGVRKCSQVGWSIMTNLKLFYAGRFGIPGFPMKQANVIYTMPSETDIRDFVPSKTNMLIKQNPVIQSYIHGGEDESKGSDKIGLKQIGNATAYFRGTRTEQGAISITSDLNIHDEADRSVPKIIEMYESRQGTSPYKGRWKFSNPSVPQAPSDLAYLESDQKHWFIRCDRCGHWQHSEWKKLSEHDFLKGSNYFYVDDKNKQYVCGKCAGVITDDNRKRGVWVRKYKDKIVSGYWVNHMMCSWFTCAELLRTEQKNSKAYFHNFALGLPYAGSDISVDASVIVNNISLDKITWKHGQVAMGVDVGVKKHYVIGDHRGIFEIGVTNSWEDIKNLMKKYRPVTVIDLNPDSNEVRRIVEDYPDTYASFYLDGAQKDTDFIIWGQRDQMGMVYPVRDRVFDELVHYMFGGNMKFFNHRMYWQTYIEHWSTMFLGDVVGSKMVDGDPSKAMQNEGGLKTHRRVWMSSTGNDHFAHATLYWYVALSRIIAGGGKIMTGGGDPVRQVLSELGGVITAPEVKDGKMKPIVDVFAQIGQTPNKKRTSGSTSGNM